MHNKTKGTLTIVGAGPGDPELITLKAIRAIEQADVILYDALVNPVLLKHNTLGKQYFVGKRKGEHSFKQLEINTMLVDFVLEGKNVVRLKGGDVSIFARAAEEIAHAERFGIIATLIPGISSFVGIAAAHRIPLTRRCQYESIWVTTGYTCDGKPSEDIANAAQSSATVVILMGITHLDEIVSIFSTHKPADYPIGIVQNGTLPNEKWVTGTLSTIVSRVNEEGVSNPATIFVGPAVNDPTTLWNVQKEIQYA
jgi:uroporphyrin-III C-methyltransferase